MRLIAALTDDVAHLLPERLPPCRVVYRVRKTQVDLRDRRRIPLLGQRHTAANPSSARRRDMQFAPILPQVLQTRGTRVNRERKGSRLAPVACRTRRSD